MTKKQKLQIIREAIVRSKVNGEDEDGYGRLVWASDYKDELDKMYRDFFKGKKKVSRTTGYAGT